MIMKAGVLTVSDRASQSIYPDRSGPRLCELLRARGDVEVARCEVVPDDTATITERLRRWCDQDHLDLVLTAGGTGLGPRDETPEATRGILDKEAPGLAEALRAEGSRSTPLAWLSRGIAGVRGKTLIVNLPGSPDAVEQSFRALEPLLPHALEMIRGKSHSDTACAELV